MNRNQCERFTSFSPSKVPSTDRLDTLILETMLRSGSYYKLWKMVKDSLGFVTWANYSETWLNHFEETG